MKHTEVSALLRIAVLCLLLQNCIILINKTLSSGSAPLLPKSLTYWQFAWILSQLLCNVKQKTHLKCT